MFRSDRTVDVHDGKENSSVDTHLQTKHTLTSQTPSKPLTSGFGHENVNSNDGQTKESFSSGLTTPLRPSISQSNQNPKREFNLNVQSPLLKSHATPGRNGKRNFNVNHNFNSYNILHATPKNINTSVSKSKLSTTQKKNVNFNKNSNVEVNDLINSFTNIKNAFNKNPVNLKSNEIVDKSSLNSKYNDIIDDIEYMTSLNPMNTHIETIEENEYQSNLNKYLDEFDHALNSDSSDIMDDGLSIAMEEKDSGMVSDLDIDLALDF